MQTLTAALRCLTLWILTNKKPSPFCIWVVRASCFFVTPGSSPWSHSTIQGSYVLLQADYNVKIVHALIFKIRNCFVEQGSPARCFPPPEQPNCGLPVIEPRFGSSRIVGGFEARPHSWPWQCFLTNDRKMRSPFCGCSLIDKDWVITAAHCVRR